MIYQFPTGSLGLGPPVRSRGAWSALKAALNPPPPPPVVVCVPPGTRLRLGNIPFSLQVEYGVGREEEVVFTQVSAAENHYRDAVRFANGEEVLLQRLARYQRVRVLSLPSKENTETAAEPLISAVHTP